MPSRAAQGSAPRRSQLDTARGHLRWMAAESHLEHFRHPGHSWVSTRPLASAWVPGERGRRAHPPPTHRGDEVLGMLAARGAMSDRPTSPLRRCLSASPPSLSPGVSCLPGNGILNGVNEPLWQSLQQKALPRAAGWERMGSGEGRARGHGWAAEPPSSAIHQLSGHGGGSKPGFPGDSPALEWAGTVSWVG